MWSIFPVTLFVLAVGCGSALGTHYRHMGYVGIPQEDSPTPTTPVSTLSPPEEPESTTAVAKSSGRQAPYSYYYIGRKLWYVPLYFSLYFVCYVGALIIRAIARHKVTFPERLPQQRSAREMQDRAAAEMHEGLENTRRRFMRR